LNGELRDDDPRKWDYTEHAGVKHAIQRRYLGAWLNILGSISPLVLFDGFAGRGKYNGGEPGSPLVFWRCAVEAVDRGRPRQVEIHCVEKAEANFLELSSTIAALKHSGVTIDAKHGEFADCALSRAALLRRKAPLIPPVFWTADPYGFRGVPLDVVRELMSLPRSELMITFMVRDIRRFIGEKNHEAPLTELFGGESWGDCLELEGEETREEKLLLTYSDLIRDGIARFATPFRVFEDDRRQTLYYLIHLTNEPLGMRKMKEAMVHHSPDMTFWPVTVRDPDQIALDVAEPTPYRTLQQHLLATYAGRALSFEDLLNEDYPLGVWVESHYRAAIADLAKVGRADLDRRARQVEGRRRPSGIQLPDRISFDVQLQLG
jgi:three-Cys-motif partner protein